MIRLPKWLRVHTLKLLAVAIAVVLWFQVHGQGAASLSMDVPLQVQGLRSDMVIVNDLPDHVRLTISGLQAQLDDLKAADIRVPLDASDLKEPGVVTRAIKISAIRLPAGLTVEKVQPDRFQLQVDRVVRREIKVRPRLELPQGWKAVNIKVDPPRAALTGPEVWLDALSEVKTTAVRPELKPGPFTLKVGVESPTGKAIRLVNPAAVFTIRGVLVRVQRSHGRRGR